MTDPIERRDYNEYLANLNKPKPAPPPPPPSWSPGQTGPPTYARKPAPSSYSPGTSNVYSSGTTNLYAGTAPNTCSPGTTNAYFGSANPYAPPPPRPAPASYPTTASRPPPGPIPQAGKGVFPSFLHPSNFRPQQPAQYPTAAGDREQQLRMAHAKKNRLERELMMARDDQFKLEETMRNLNELLESLKRDQDTSDYSSIKAHYRQFRGRNTMNKEQVRDHKEALARTMLDKQNTRSIKETQLEDQREKTAKLEAETAQAQRNIESIERAIKRKSKPPKAVVQDLQDETFMQQASVQAYKANLESGLPGHTRTPSAPASHFHLFSRTNGTPTIRDDPIDDQSYYQARQAQAERAWADAQARLGEEKNRIAGEEKEKETALQRAREAADPAFKRASKGASKMGQAAMKRISGVKGVLKG